MSGLFGKGSAIDPLGVTTSKVADPLGVNRKVNDTLEPVADPFKLRQKHPGILDPIGISEEGAAAQGLESDRQRKQRMAQESTASKAVLG